MWAGSSQRVCHAGALEKGMSLLEVLVSIVLILLTVPFMVALEIGALKLNGDAGEIDRAMWAALAKVEDLRAAGYGGVSSGEDEYTFTDGRIVTRQWTVGNAHPVPSAKTITVVAFERDNVGAEQVSLDFVLAHRMALSGAGTPGGSG